MTERTPKEQSKRATVGERWYCDVGCLWLPSRLPEFFRVARRYSVRGTRLFSSLEWRVLRKLSGTADYRSSQFFSGTAFFILIL